MLTGSFVVIIVLSHDVLLNVLDVLTCGILMYVIYGAA